MSSPISNQSPMQTFVGDHAPKTGKNAIEAKLKAGKVVSACDFLKVLLESDPYSDNGHGSFTRDTNNLFRAKIACEFDMVLMPDMFLSRTHHLFTTRQDYPIHLENASVSKRTSQDN